jgi:hypothetical protein
MIGSSWGFRAIGDVDDESRLTVRIVPRFDYSALSVVIVTVA